MMKIIRKPALLALGITLSGLAQAALIDYGNGMVYDDVANLTWLADANYALSSGYSDSGLMSWEQAQSWAASLSFGGATGWRLPGVRPANASTFNLEYSDDGSSDSGINISGLHSELGYMFYVNLGNSAEGGLVNSGPFVNLQSSAYWSGTPSGSFADEAFHFFTAFGDQGISPMAADYYGWAVHDGNVAAVPEPNTALLLAAGLATLVWRRRSRPC